jgi:hypothetical protein
MRIELPFAAFELRVASVSPPMATARRSIVRTMRSGVIAAVISALVMAGCGETETPKVDVTQGSQPEDGKAMLGGQMKAANLKGEPVPKTKTK